MGADTGRTQKAVVLLTSGGDRPTHSSMRSIDFFFLILVERNSLWSRSVIAVLEKIVVRYMLHV